MRSDWLDIKLERANLRYYRTYLGPKRPKSKPERADFGLRRMDFGPKKG